MPDIYVYMLTYMLCICPHVSAVSHVSVRAIVCRISTHMLFSGAAVRGAVHVAALASLLRPVWTIQELAANEGCLSLYQGIGPQVRSPTSTKQTSQKTKFVEDIRD